MSWSLSKKSSAVNNLQLLLRRFSHELRRLSVRQLEFLQLSAAPWLPMQQQHDTWSLGLRWTSLILAINFADSAMNLYSWNICVCRVQHCAGLASTTWASRLRWHLEMMNYFVIFVSRLRLMILMMSKNFVYSNDPDDSQFSALIHLFLPLFTSHVHFDRSTFKFSNFKFPPHHNKCRIDENKNSSSTGIILN